jgi:Fur family ferric uptake transcriptional regulator
MFIKKFIAVFFSSPAKSDEDNSEFSTDSLHENEKAAFLSLVSQTGQIFSEDNRCVLDIFLQTDGHISPEYIRRTLEAECHQISLDIVLQTLEMFCRYGMAQKTKFNGSGVLYEHLHLGAHHDHLLCTQCGKVVEFFDQDLENIQRSVVEKNGFSLLQHRLHIYGLCPSCQQKRSECRLLTEALRGESVIVSGFSGGRKAESRLRSMGIAIGDTITILNNSGPFIIAKGPNRLALGVGLADKLLIKAE